MEDDAGFPRHLASKVAIFKLRHVRCGELPNQNQMACAGSLARITVTSPVGDICIAGCNDGLHSLRQMGRIDGNFAPSASVPVALKEGSSRDELLTPVAEAVEWLRIYFHRPNDVEDAIRPPICATIFDGNFRSDAWRTLSDKIPFGTTISYGKLADLTNHPKAARAVGTAMKTNPISIIIPCHRVLPSDGSVGSYAHGPNIKQWLLQHEKNPQKTHKPSKNVQKNA